ncbi:hypothetical protein DFA_10268 [Cavenderia fasciculata]|uniref:Uncharacterized protein n=1 Tax=Cavenderia fasciculata TaxID=261658 RepID=F4Q9R4_CACFS|nr:uncharacterized protein DFA_10268 [Cavenderia fasciculata]EGG15433.1 hypothetical protein DFA_10268 [Cavenderia fasciculata]|eukprot:XP_004354175.1 hypothetical protein DFA_10268 [Cavenderia fasciculata]
MNTSIIIIFHLYLSTIRSHRFHHPISVYLGSSSSFSFSYSSISGGISTTPEQTEIRIESTTNISSMNI